MSEPFLGEIRIASFEFAPSGWAFCNGQLLPIAQNQALFSILGTTYGGDGRTTFALPNLQGRVPIHPGNSIPQGAMAGEETHTLLLSELPAHAHLLTASSDIAAANMLGNPTGAYCAKSGDPGYAPPASSTGSMAAIALGGAGASQPHSNMQPYLTLNFVIALAGIFPTRG
jgi:microcystin-dependent protein